MCLGVLVFTAVLAVMDVVDGSFGRGSSPSLRADSLRAIAFNGVLIAAVFAASSVATDFKRGAAALTYLSHPDRWRVTVARALSYAMAGGLVAALAAGVAVAVGLVAADGKGVAVDLGAADIARVIGGAGFGGAALAAAGVLVGTLTRNPTVAISAVIAPTVLEILPGVRAVHPYLPLGLVEQLLGSGDELIAPVAMLLLLAYPAVIAVFLRRWALARDLT
jgi:hypothetical protein